MYTLHYKWTTAEVLGQSRSGLFWNLDSLEKPDCGDIFSKYCIACCPFHDTFFEVKYQVSKAKNMF